MRHSEKEFENLVAQVLRENGFDGAVREAPLGGDRRAIRVDVLASRRDGTVVPVEVKLPGTSKPGLSDLRRFGAQTAALASWAKMARPLLVVGADLNPEHRTWAEAEYAIEIWDKAELLHRAGRIAPALERLFEEVAASLAYRSTDEREAMLRAIGFIVDSEPSEPDPHAVVGQGLIERLKAVPAGKKGAKAYEAVCREIIAYLFGDDLLDGRSQMQTMDGMNVYDLVYRVSPQKPFWSTLTRDFRARVVLFECKNYTRPISAMQVFTTERYLSAGVLRPICFVLSRKGAHAHAVQAAFGAMRDSQKLLVILSDEDLEEMLKMRDAQLALGGTDSEQLKNDPTEILDQRIYDFIAGIPR